MTVNCVPTRPRRQATFIIFAILLLASCSGQQSEGSQATLVAAADARITAESNGFTAGNATVASSLSTGELAMADQTAARGIAGQIANGDTTNYGLDILHVDAYPLDGGTTDFIAYETVRSHADGSVSRAVELYHRDTAASPWKATTEAWFNDNIDLPQLALGRTGGHLLTAAQMQSDQAEPSLLAARYASAMDDGTTTGQLDAGSFAPSEATTGVINSDESHVSAYANIGTASVQWTTEPGGEAVALTDGELVFATVEKTESYQGKVQGNLRYFVNQDPKRLNYGGLLAPGNYTAISQSYLVTIAVVVTGQGAPDVVAMNSTLTSITGTPTGI